MLNNNELIIYWSGLLLGVISFGYFLGTKKKRKDIEKKGWLGFLTGLFLTLGLVMIIWASMVLIEHYIW